MVALNESRRNGENGGCSEEKDAEERHWQQRSEEGWENDGEFVHPALYPAASSTFEVAAPDKVEQPPEKKTRQSSSIAGLAKNHFMVLTDGRKNATIARRKSFSSSTTAPSLKYHMEGEHQSIWNVTVDSANGEQPIPDSFNCRQKDRGQQSGSRKSTAKSLLCPPQLYLIKWMKRSFGNCGIWFVRVTLYSRKTLWRTRSWRITKSRKSP